MPKPNHFVFKFLKSKKRSLGDINVPNSKYPKVNSSTSSLSHACSVWLMISPSSQTEPKPWMQFSHLWDRTFLDDLLRAFQTLKIHRLSSDSFFTHIPHTSESHLWNFSYLRTLLSFFLNLTTAVTQLLLTSWLFCNLSASFPVIFFKFNFKLTYSKSHLVSFDKCLET